jgi:hypothetical protein
MYSVAGNVLSTSTPQAREALAKRIAKQTEKLARSAKAALSAREKEEEVLKRAKSYNPEVETIDIFTGVPPAMWNDVDAKGVVERPNEPSTVVKAIIFGLNGRQTNPLSVRFKRAVASAVPFIKAGDRSTLPRDVWEAHMDFNHDASEFKVRGSRTQKPLYPKNIGKSRGSLTVEIFKEWSVQSIYADLLNILLQDRSNAAVQWVQRGGAINPAGCARVNTVLGVFAANNPKRWTDLRTKTYTLIAAVNVFTMVGKLADRACVLPCGETPDFGGGAR